MLDKNFDKTKKNVYFEEELGFRKKWIIFILIIEVSIYTLLIISRYIDGLRNIHIPVSFIGVSLITIVFIASTLLFFQIKLRITVEKKGIRYRMKPFERKGHFIATGEIEKYYIKRKQNKKKSESYKTGLFIRTKSGQKLFLQTEIPESLIKAVHSIME